MPPVSSIVASKSNGVIKTSDKPKSDVQNGKEQEHQELVQATKEILACQGIVVPPECEKFILRCIRVKNYDVQKAATLIKNYGEMMRMNEMQNVYSNLSPALVRGLYESKTIYPLAKRGPNGELVIAMHAYNWDTSKYDFDHAVAGIVVLFSFCVANSIQIQEEGIIFVLDFSGWSLKTVRAFNVSRAKLVVKLTQNSTPAKIKAFHFINYPRVIQLMFTLFKPLIKSKMLDRVHFQGDGTTSLREELEFLPESLGGVATGDGVDWKLLELLYQYDQTFQDSLKLPYPLY